jgi:hypothetical protein
MFVDPAWRRAVQLRAGTFENEPTHVCKLNTPQKYLGLLLFVSPLSLPSISLFHPPSPLPPFPPRFPLAGAARAPGVALRPHGAPGRAPVHVRARVLQPARDGGPLRVRHRRHDARQGAGGRGAGAGARGGAGAGGGGLLLQCCLCNVLSEVSEVNMPPINRSLSFTHFMRAAFDDLRGGSKF